MTNTRETITATTEGNRWANGVAAWVTRTDDNRATMEIYEPVEMNGESWQLLYSAEENAPLESLVEWGRAQLTAANFQGLRVSMYDEFQPVPSTHQETWVTEATLRF